MKMMRSLIFGLVTLLLAAPILRAQDLSKYRSFTLGTSVATVLKSTDQTIEDVKTVRDDSRLFQELTWWPATFSAAPHHTDSVEQILFSFYKGELYKMSVTYDRHSTEGLTTNDLVNSISAKYGPATSIALAIDSTPDHLSDAPIASWENPRYSCVI